MDLDFELILSFFLLDCSVFRIVFASEECSEVVYHFADFSFVFIYLQNGLAVAVAALYVPGL